MGKTMTLIFILFTTTIILLPVMFWLDDRYTTSEENQAIKEWHNFKTAMERKSK
jgi:hypothetical protein